MASPGEWFVRKGGKEHGPFTASQMRQLAAAKKISRDDEVRRGLDSEWTPAARVRGLFADLGEVTVIYPTPPPANAATSPPATVLRPVAVRSASSDETVPAVQTERAVFETIPISPSRTVITTVEAAPARAPCPFCGELIADGAIKCRHCGEFLDGRKRVEPTAPTAAPPPAVHVTVNQTTNVQQTGRRRWSAIVAMALSLLLPGLGQLYKGQPINGLVWFVLTVAGYFFLIVPGLVLHLCCVLGAGMGDPYR